jgi:hypothetical protein
MGEGPGRSYAARMWAPGGDQGNDRARASGERLGPGRPVFGTAGHAIGVPGPGGDSTERSFLREPTPSLVNTLPRCHSTVRSAKPSAPIRLNSSAAGRRGSASQPRVEVVA